MTRQAYFILQTERDIDGCYIPCIAVENESGYYKTDWNWGNNLELANSIAKEKNAALGINEKTAFLIILSSMKRG